MAENITSLLDKDELAAANALATDVIYIVHGTGTPRDKKMTVEELRKLIGGAAGDITVTGITFTDGTSTYKMALDADGTVKSFAGLKLEGSDYTIKLLGEDNKGVVFITRNGNVETEQASIKFDKTTKKLVIVLNGGTLYGNVEGDVVGDVNGNLVGTHTAGTETEHTIFTSNLIKREKNGVATTEMAFNDAGLAILGRTSFTRFRQDGSGLLSSDSDMNLYTYSANASHMGGVLPDSGDIVIVTNSSSGNDIEVITSQSGSGAETVGYKITIKKGCAMSFICTGRRLEASQPGINWMPMSNTTVSVVS
jgi:hypothetical protein